MEKYNVQQQLAHLEIQLRQAHDEHNRLKNTRLELEDKMEHEKVCASCVDSAVGGIQSHDDASNWLDMSGGLVGKTENRLSMKSRRRWWRTTGSKC